MMEALNSYGTSVLIRATRRNILEDTILQIFTYFYLESGNNSSSEAFVLSFGTALCLNTKERNLVCCYRNTFHYLPEETDRGVLLRIRDPHIRKFTLYIVTSCNMGTIATGTDSKLRLISPFRARFLLPYFLSIILQSTAILFQ
jgi:hypothetical protein